MPEIYLASAALAKEHFDAQRTVEEASKNRFKGVQIYVNSRLHDPDYLGDLIQQLYVSRLRTLLHLPNQPLALDLQAAEEIATSTLGTRILIHHSPTNLVPVGRFSSTGIENSVTGRHDEKHIQDVYALTRSARLFFVYDPGRSFFAAENNQVLQKRITDFTCKMIGRLNPKKDILHVADKTGWETNFRDAWCVVGQGVMAPILPTLKAFSGVIVLEHEDLGKAIASRIVLVS